MHTLHELEGLQDGLSEQRQQQATQAYEQGMACLVQAQQAEFARPELLRDATAFLVDAIRYQHHWPEPYIAMAYVQYLIDHRSSALHYLNEALRIAPGDHSALQLGQLIRSDSSRRQPKVHFDNPFEALLDQSIRELSMLPPPQACSQPDQLTRLEDQAIQLRRHYDELLDLQGSNQDPRLQMIAQRLTQFEDALSASYEMLDVHERLIEERETLVSLDALSDSNAALVEQELEQTLNHCDVLADEINELESAGVPVDELEADYTELANTVHELETHLQQKGGSL